MMYTICHQLIVIKFQKIFFFALKQTLRMQNENVIINDFNLHHFI